MYGYLVTRLLAIRLLATHGYCIEYGHSYWLYGYCVDPVIALYAYFVYGYCVEYDYLVADVSINHCNLLYNSLAIPIRVSMFCEQLRYRAP